MQLLNKKQTKCSSISIVVLGCNSGHSDSYVWWDSGTMAQCHSGHKNVVEQWHSFTLIVGSFSIDDDDGDGSEKVTLKMNSRLLQFPENVKCKRISLELISWGLDSSLEREGKIRLHLFMFSRNREIRHFHVVVVQ